MAKKRKYKWSLEGNAEMLMAVHIQSADEMDQRFERHNYGLVSEGVDINSNEGINDDQVEEEHEINDVRAMVNVKNMEDRGLVKKNKINNNQEG